MNPNVPENDEQAEQVLRHGRDPVTGDSLARIYQCRREAGSSVLEAYEVALLVLVKVLEQAQGD